MEQITVKFYCLTCKKKFMITIAKDLRKTLKCPKCFKKEGVYEY